MVKTVRLGRPRVQIEGIRSEIAQINHAQHPVYFQVILVAQMERVKDPQSSSPTAPSP